MVWDRPLVGRDGLLAEAVTAVSERGVVLAGPSGSGRTRMLEACAQRVDGDVEVVDDLHVLPPLDAASLRERIASGEARLLATVLAGHPCPEAVVRLWRDDGVSRLDIPPLGPEAVAELAATRAGGPLEAVAVQRLLELSAGLPRDLLDLIEGAAEYGWFDGQHGVVRLRPGVPPAAVLLRRLDGLAELAPEARSVAHLVAVGRAVPAAALATLATQDAVAEAQAAGFVTMDYSERGAVARSSTPLIGELVRASQGDDTRCRLRAVLADALSGMAAPAADRVTRRLLAESYCDGGFTGPDQVEVARSVVADGLREGSSDILDLAAGLWQATRDPDDGLAASLAYDHAGRPVEQAEVAAAVVEQGGSDHTVAVAVDRLASALVRLGRDDEAVEELCRGLDRVQDPAARARLTIGLANRQLHRGDLDAAIEAAEPWLGLGVPVPEAALVAAVAHAAAGREDRALELAATGEEMLAAAASGAETGELVGPLLGLARALALTEAGRLDAAEAAILPAYTQAVTTGDRPRQGWSALALGRIELARGRAQRAVRYFGDSAIGFGDLGEVGYVAWALAGRAAALALIGDRDGACDVVARRVALPHERLGLFEPESQRLLAMVEACCGETDKARWRLDDAVATAGNQVMAWASAVHDLIRLSPADRQADLAAQLVAASERLDNERLRLLADHATGLAERHHDDLADVAVRFARSGAWLDAALAFAGVARLAPNARDAAAARRRAHAMLSRCEDLSIPELIDVERPPLTARQHDVATLAAAGLSRQAIASQMFLSDRTVDRHLAGAFEALGVRHQEELAGALADVSAAPRELLASAESWPLVGRVEEANAIRRALGDPAIHAVVLTGPIGCGKTRLATELQAELVGRGWTATTIRGTAPPEAVQERLAAAFTTESVALLIDDASSLSVGSALGDLDGFTFITTSSPDVPAEWLHPGIAHISVGPLPPEAVSDVLSTVLGGPVLGTAVAAFDRASGGNPLLLRELVRGARATGRLVQHDGVWALVGPLASSPPLRELVREHLRSINPAARAALDMLAITGPLPRPLAERLQPPDELQAVVDAGLAERDESEIRLSHESYETELLVQLSPERRSAILEGVIDEIGSADLDVDPLRFARWMIQADRRVSSTVLLDAAEEALRLADLTTAVELADRASGEDAQLLAAVARSLLGDFDTADAQLASIASSKAALIRSEIALWLAGDFERARAALDGTTTSNPDIEAQREVVDVYNRRRLPSGETGDPRRLLLASIVASVVGQPEAAVSLAEQAAGMAGSGWRSWHLTNAITFQWASALAQAGRLDDAEAMVQARRPAASSRGGLSHLGPENGRLALERGHLSDATLLLRDALAHPAARPGTPMWVVIRSGLALAAAQSGDAATARAEASAAGDGPSIGQLGADRLRVDAWVLATEGDRRGAITVLDDALRSGLGNYAGIAVVLAHDAVRIGGSHNAPLLAELAAKVEGPLAAARHEYATAFIENDPVAMFSAAERFAACGTDLYAAEAGTQASAWFEESGDRRRAKQAATDAHGWSARCGATTPALHTRSSALTPRQLDIARLAAQGTSSRDIAARLGLSVRTVDNQLQHVYDRLGIRGRRDLAAHFATIVH